MATFAAACSTRARDLGDDGVGTAPVEASWLLLEQPGPWGPKAPTSSDLDPEVGRALEAAGARHGFRVGLLRRTARRVATGPPRLLLCSTRREDPWMELLALGDPAEALDVDLAALGAGRRPGAGAPVAGPTYAVCTHGKRDACCSRLGRPLFRALAGAAPEATWQSSHLGGHRYAPTFAAFPTGHVFGHVPAARGRAVVEALARGELALDLLRGRAGDAPPVQAADVLVRRRLGLTAIDDVVPAECRKMPGTSRHPVELEVRGHGRVTALVERRPAGEPRPVSCGKAAEDPGAWHLVELG